MTDRDLIRELFRDHGIDLSTFELDAGQPRIRNGIVAGRSAIPLWMALREAFPRTGMWPLIRGEEKPEYDHYPIPLQPYSVNEEMFAKVLQERFESLEEYGEGLDASKPWEQIVQEVDAAGLYTFSGRPSARKPFPTMSLPAGLPRFHAMGDQQRNRIHETVWFSIVETEDPSIVPELAAFSGGEDCPPPNAITEWLRRWAASHGAVPACLTRDYVECFVERPPQNERDSMRLAFEQWIFCEDIVGQGTQSIRDLAIALWKAPEWYFWWD